MHTPSMIALVGTLLSTASFAGTFAPAAGQPGSTAIHMDDASIVAWATGWQDYSPGPDVAASWQTPDKALGKAVGSSYDIVSLGDQGAITLTFSGSILNGAGADFAIFENSFNDTFLELAFVEVSSNGADFFRFAAYSQTPSPVGAFGSVDPTNVHNLAGKYKQGWGTPFDLAELASNDGLDINAVRYVRLVDIKGDGSEFDNTPAIAGGPNPIYDPYRTVGSPGFDLDAIGVMHYAVAAPVPEPSAYAMMLAGLVMVGAIARRRRV